MEIILQETKDHTFLLDLDRAQWKSHEYSIFHALKEKYVRPIVGVRMLSNESIQCSSISHAFDSLSSQPEIIAQLKYDGERMQIHFSSHQQQEFIRIFSKGGRDSTQDRILTHKYDIRDRISIIYTLGVS
jgi:hypothetical protein